MYAKFENAKRIEMQNIQENFASLQFPSRDIFLKSREKLFDTITRGWQWRFDNKQKWFDVSLYGPWCFFNHYTVETS